jgi:DNA polymerase-3 subunit beta
VVNTVKIVGKFPKYREVIPANNGNRLTAKVADLLAVVRRVSTCANKASQTIKLVLSTFGGATMEAQDLGFGCSAKEEMEDIVYNGSEMTIGFKSDLLTNLLSALGEEDVIVDMDSPRKAVLLTTNNESRKAILMPVAVE